MRVRVELTANWVACPEERGVVTPRDTPFVALDRRATLTRIRTLHSCAAPNASKERPCPSPDPHPSTLIRPDESGHYERLHDTRQTNGNSAAPIIVAAKPARPISVSIGKRARRASASVIPLIFVITQKPLSFIQGNGLEPQPMARAR